MHPVGANWKVTLDTYRENYHFDYLHRNTLKDVRLRRRAHLRRVRSAPAQLLGASARSTSCAACPRRSGATSDRHFSYQYSLFPNTCLTFDSRHIELWQILPDGVDRSIVLHTAYARPGLSDEEQAKLVEMAPWICETVVDGEDFWVAARTEPGIRTGLVDDDRVRPQRAGAASTSTAASSRPWPPPAPG